MNLDERQATKISQLIIEMVDWNDTPAAIYSYTNGVLSYLGDA